MQGPRASLSVKIATINCGNQSTLIACVHIELSIQGMEVMYDVCSGAVIIFDWN